jgi:Fe2+ or Zn2+ uptake regulation protein
VSAGRPSIGRWRKASYYDVIVGRQIYDYLICVTTGKVIEFNSEKLRKLRDEICAQHGFEPLSHQFHIFGLSPEAKASAGKGGSEAGGGLRGRINTSR